MSDVTCDLAAGPIEQLHLRVVPITLGEVSGSSTACLEPVQVVASPAATHVKSCVLGQVG